MVVRTEASSTQSCQNPTHGFCECVGMILDLSVNTFKLSMLWILTALCECYDYLRARVRACVSLLARVRMPICMNVMHALDEPNEFYVNTVKQQLSASFGLTRLYHKRHIMLNDLVQWLLYFCTFIAFSVFSYFGLLLSIKMKAFSMAKSTNANSSLLIFVFAVFVAFEVKQFSCHGNNNNNNNNKGGGNNQMNTFTHTNTRAQLKQNNKILTKQTALVNTCLDGQMCSFC